MANPKQNCAGNVCITLILPFPDIYCSTEVSLARQKKTSHFSKYMLEKFIFHGFFQLHLYKNINQMGVHM